MNIHIIYSRKRRPQIFLVYERNVLIDSLKFVRYRHKCLSSQSTNEKDTQSVYYSI